MSAALPPRVKHAIAVGHMSKGRLVKSIEQMWCRASKSARGDRKFTANAVTPLLYASAGDSPPTPLLYFTLAIKASIARTNFNDELLGLIMYAALNVFNYDIKYVRGKGNRTDVSTSSSQRVQKEEE